MLAADSLVQAVQKKVKNGSSLSESCPCRHEILKYWFHGKPKERGAWRLMRSDFPEDFFPPGWDTVLNVHGQGQKVMYPIFLRPTVRRSAKRCIRTHSGQMVLAQQAVTPNAAVRFGVEQASA